MFNEPLSDCLLLKPKSLNPLAGLGEKTITFEKNGDHRYIEETLCNAFPKRKEAGGFLLLRAGNRTAGASVGRRLTMISIPFGGYSVSYLLYESNLRAATCFVRPLQKDLSLSKEDNASQGSSYAVGDKVTQIQNYITIHMKCHSSVNTFFNEHANRARAFQSFLIRNCRLNFSTQSKIKSQRNLCDMQL